MSSTMEPITKLKPKKQNSLHFFKRRHSKKPNSFKTLKMIDLQPKDETKAPEEEPITPVIKKKPVIGDFELFE